MINIAKHNRFQQFHQLSRVKNDIPFLNYYRNFLNIQSLYPATRISRLRLATAANGGINEEKSVFREPIPKHVAVIVDGHGRWAKKRGVPIEEGHKASLDNIRQMVLTCSDYGIKILTVFAFSTENWKRSKVETDYLMKILEDFIQSFIKEQIIRKELRFSTIGDRSKLPQSLQHAISSAEESSKSNKGMHFVSAISYSGRHDITEATKRIATKVENTTLRAKDITESVLEQELMTNVMDYPNPDLVIRTSGELRLSNFLLWQMAHTELYFVDKMFPDFQEADFVEALGSFQGRERHSGGRNN